MGLAFLEIAVSVLLIVLILLQERSAGLSALFGSEGGFYQTRRGLERLVFWGTIILGVLFVVLAIVLLLR